MDGGTFRITPRSNAFGPAPNGSVSTGLANSLLAHAFLIGYNYAPPLAIYATLYTVAPTVAGGGTEINTDPSYARQPINFVGSPTLLNTLANDAAVPWGTAAADWGTVVAAGLFSAVVGGAFLAFGLLLAPDGVTPIGKPVQAGDTFVIPQYGLDLALV